MGHMFNIAIEALHKRSEKRLSTTRSRSKWSCGEGRNPSCTKHIRDSHETTASYAPPSAPNSGMTTLMTTFAKDRTICFTCHLEFVQLL